MRSQFNLIAKQYSVFVKQVPTAPIKEYYLYSMRYFIDFSYMKLINLPIYTYYYIFKLFLFVTFIIYQIEKFSYRVLKWVTVTSSFFLNIRKGFRQRMYMLFNLYQALKTALIFLSIKPKVFVFLKTFTKVVRYRHCFYW